MQTSYSGQYVDLWRRHWWWRSRHALVMRVVSQLLSHRAPSLPRPRILDIGCCGGVMFDELSRYGDVRGIEPDAQLAGAVSHWSGAVEETAFGREYQSDRQYDLVLMLDVLEHIEDDLGALEALCRLLPPGGAAVLTVPALMSLWSAHDVANRHFRRYDRCGLKRRLESAGLAVRSLHYFFGWPLPLMYARRAIARSADDGYQVRVPVRPVNKLFQTLSALEHWGATRLGLPAPVGSSLMAVVEPAPAHSPTRPRPSLIGST